MNLLPLGTAPVPPPGVPAAAPAFAEGGFPGLLTAALPVGEAAAPANRTSSHDAGAPPAATFAPPGLAVEATRIGKTDKTAAPDVATMALTIPAPPAGPAMVPAPPQATAPGELATNPPPTATEEATSVETPEITPLTAVPGTPLPSPAAPLPVQSPRDGRAPGLETRGAAPSASERGIDRRSERAAERTLPAPGSLPVEAAPDAPVTPVADELPAPPALRTEAAPVPAAPSSPIPAATAPAAAPPRSPEPSAAPAPVPHFGSPRFAEEVGIALARRTGAREGGEDLVLRIEPADLGRIHVQLRFAAEGQIEAVLSADQPRVLEQLRAASAELHRALVEAGGRSDVASLRFETRGDAGSGGQASQGPAGQAGQQSSSQSGHQGQQQSPGRGPSFSYPHEPLPDPAQPLVRLALSGGRLDLLA